MNKNLRRKFTRMWLEQATWRARRRQEDDMRQWLREKLPEVLVVTGIYLGFLALLALLVVWFG